MSYDLVRNGIAGIINALGYIQSSEAIDFASASVNEYGNTFILKCLSGDSDDEVSPTLNKGFYDIQKWQIQIAFERSAQSEASNYDILHRKRDAILADIDDPSKWGTYVRLQKYQSWSVQEFKNYLVLTIELKIIDTYTY